MSRNRAAAWLLLWIAPVLVVGFHYSLKQRRGQIAPRHAEAWFARYAKLRPHLEGAPRVAIFYDPRETGKGNLRLFRAQYVLAPTVVKLWGKRRPPIRPRKVPLLFDFHRQDSLDKQLARMSSKARKRGVKMDTAEVARGLALVWMRGE